MTREELKQAWAIANKDFIKPPLDIWNIMFNLGVNPNIELWQANHNYQTKGMAINTQRDAMPDVIY